jgi:Phage integrase family
MVTILRTDSFIFKGEISARITYCEFNLVYWIFSSTCLETSRRLVSLIRCEEQISCLILVCTENVGRIVKSAASLAKLPNVHPHTWRHSCGYYLANKGYTTRDIQLYLGHANIQNTMTYTEISPNRFNFIQW